MRPAAIFTFMAACLAAQPVTPQTTEAVTKFAGHTIGETVDEWMAVENMNLTEICGKHKRADWRVDYASLCRRFTAFRSGQPGIFSTNSAATKAADWMFFVGKAAMVTVTTVLDTQIDGSHRVFSTVEEQVQFLVAIYGPPTKTGIVANQNAFGAKWNTTEVDWRLPDGDAVSGRESVSPAVGRFFEVKITSREFIAQTKQGQQDKANPYAK